MWVTRHVGVWDEGSYIARILFSDWQRAIQSRKLNKLVHQPPVVLSFDFERLITSEKPREWSSYGKKAETDSQEFCPHQWGEDSTLTPLQWGDGGEIWDDGGEYALQTVSCCAYLMDGYY